MNLGSMSIMILFRFPSNICASGFSTSSTRPTSKYFISLGTLSRGLLHCYYSCTDKLFLNLKIPIHHVIAPQNLITTFHIPFLTDCI